MRKTLLTITVCSAALLGNSAQAKGPLAVPPARTAKEAVQPELSTQYHIKPPVTGKQYMAVTPHPLATQAATYILEQGGSAVDAAIAAGAMLTLVEPHASGIGGGGFMLAYDAKTKKTTVYDGRETAPMSAKPGMFLDKNGKPREFFEAVPGGLSVGVPGLVAMFELAYQQHGTKRWYELWRVAEAQAKAGFRVGAQLSRLVKADTLLRQSPAAWAYFAPKGKPVEPGQILTNPALAEVFGDIGINGAKAFYADGVTDRILKAIRTSKTNPGGMGMQDFIDYRAVTRQALCGTYRAYTVCGMPAPSAGGLVTLQALKMLERFPLGKTAPFGSEGIHLVTEASRLAYADRNAYVADPAFSASALGMLIPAYVQGRSQQLNLFKSVGVAAPGVLPGQKQAMAVPMQVEPPSTSHISIVDKNGNAVALTQSIENIFGSRLMVDGFLLNNQLTDFSFVPTENGKPVANAPAAGKRPRSSMSPTLVFDTKSGALRYVLGSPGGARITPYVLKTLVGVLDWNLPLDTVVNSGNFSNRNAETELEDSGRIHAAVAGDLKKRGQTQVVFSNLTSGVNAIAIQKDGTLFGVADPRRDGEAGGQ